MKCTTLFIIVLSFLIFAGGANAADDDMEGSLQQESLQRVEAVVYGAPGAGGMFLRLARVERDLFGMELPGSLTERQQALLSFVEEGTPTQPSLVFKISVAEWITMNRVNPSQPLADRMATLEMALEGEPQMGALSARLERILTKLLPHGVSSAPVTIPASTVFKAAFAKTLTVRNIARGNIVELSVTDDYVIGGVLAVAKGDRVFAEVTRVRMPRSFGRPSEISFEFRELETISGRRTPVTIGPQAKRAMEIDAGTAGAAGASVAGALLLGPLGLAGGFLVRGSDRQIPEGTIMYVETMEAFTVTGYPITGGPAVSPTPAPAPDVIYHSDPSAGQSPSDFVPIGDPGQQPPDFVPIGDPGQQAPPPGGIY
jgi:hypothetical protein